MFDILHLDTDFLVIQKYPDVSVHKDDGETLLVASVAAQVGGDLFLVHRLDKMTSGLLLLARSAQAARELSSQFAARTVEKYYLAISDKKPKKKQGGIIGDMVRSRRASWKLLPSQENPAATHFFSMAGEVGERVFLCRPWTGKTHQIRVALKSIGAPIVGDPIYHPRHDAPEHTASDRGYLHAFVLGFTYQNRVYRFCCDPRLSEVFGARWCHPATSAVIEQWLHPWTLPWPQPPHVIKGTTFHHDC